MKTLIQLFFIITISVPFLQCKSMNQQKQVQNNTAVEVMSIFYIENDNEIILNLYAQTLADHVVIDSIYFKGRSSKLKLVSDNSYTGTLKLNNIHSDIIMSSDTNAEYGNKLPLKYNAFPFKLNKNQAAISYHIKNKTEYLIVEGVEQAEEKQP
ncbi:MAG: hypothetical protein ACK5MZ_11815 [Aestuariibaculum sp.]